MENILESLNAYKQEIELIESKIWEIKKERCRWARQNRSRIKNLFPNIGDLYEINPALRNKALSSAEWFENIDTVNIYFRPKNINFNPDTETFAGGYGTPKVLGEVVCLNGLGKYEVINERMWINVCDLSTSLRKHKKERKPRKLTYVYIMLDENTGLYKIGRSRNPKRRERTLQSEKPTIKIIFNMQVQVRHEKILHRMFKEKRIRGEWFDLNPSDLSRVKEYLQQHQLITASPTKQIGSF